MVYVCVYSWCCRRNLSTSSNDEIHFFIRRLSIFLSHSPFFVGFTFWFNTNFVQCYHRHRRRHRIPFELNAGIRGNVSPLATTTEKNLIIFINWWLSSYWVWKWNCKSNKKKQEYNRCSDICVCVRSFIVFIIFDNKTKSIKITVFMICTHKKRDAIQG